MDDHPDATCLSLLFVLVPNPPCWEARDGYFTAELCVQVLEREHHQN